MHGKKDNCWLEQSAKKSNVPSFEGPPTNENLMAKPENDSPYENTHRIKSFHDIGFIIIIKVVLCIKLVFKKENKYNLKQ